ncbi:UDP-N-acetylmuramoyl-tripeptide--D-alanyl-D-alanine ligase [Ideonella livida]|uniref:UDP-N-acetylmuramoyl-tripeptide--D-alanyl-D-alanine ligase n=1 Tax=Ideonella livida TaxID=2707176 RepID=A0A7C9TJQ6_9BURK|nr:UDP-N-acetylmuramoyl-tripeptide--D-alanyl-D-alanine ligase [Ideonella livida]NDY92279.1 UDP-N-acetylmuramoyl-tripeptide--D-alanyl-D-alanine ligase [Ideonella livida]
MSATTPVMTLGWIQAQLPGSRLVGDPRLPLVRVHTDSRTLAAGDLFVALRGERFDAHDFLAQARAAGATAALAERGLEAAGLSGVEVADSLQALQRLAAAWRAAQTLPLVGVTGSNGKTTVTQMVASILRAAHGDLALATAGNLNNHIGVPLTLLRLRGHRAAVVEMGMNHPGEIAELAALARPTVALVNNAQREHQEFMHTVEAVARENGAVLGFLPADGVAVFPAADAYAPLWRALAAGRRVLDFALTEDGAAAAVTGHGRWAVDHWVVTLDTPVGSATLDLHIAGLHNVRNALAAAAAALGAGLSLAAVVAGLSAFRPVAGRSQVRPWHWDGQARTLVDDSYNANPDSVRAAIDVLAALPGPRWLLLGDMGEVGDQGPAFHAEVGAYAAARGIDQVWCSGELCRHAARAAGAIARHEGRVEDLCAALPQGLQALQPRSVLVKGSRFMKMERVVVALQAADTPALATGSAEGGSQGEGHAA